MGSVAPSHPHVLHRGWCDRRDPSRTILAWPATGLALWFEGEGVAIRAGGSGIIEVLLDGRLERVLGPAIPDQPVTIACPPGTHLLEIRRRTEPVTGSSVVRGFDLPPDGRTLQPPPPRPRLLFVGDSITCGYGNLAESATEGFRSETEDAFRSYAGVACETLGVELVAAAWSGKGLVRNFDGDGAAMPALWDLADPNDLASRILSDERPPLAAVVNLGSNDVFHDDPDWNVFVAAAIELGRALRARFPSLPLILLDGPLLSDSTLRAPDGGFRPVLSRVRSALDRAAAILGGEAPVWRHSLQECAPDEPRGADSHPGLERHRLAGTDLAQFLERTRVLALAGASV